MPVAHSILNMLVFSFVLTSGLVQGYECQRALGEYFMSWQSYQARSRDLLNQGRELSYDDVKDLFMPSCDLYGDFVMKQCFMNTYCWCSDSEGNLVSGTFKKGKEEDIECVKCTVGNQSYKTGDYFKIPETCQTCQCQNGKQVCRKYFCSNKTKLNSQELIELKTTFLLIIYYQHGLKDEERKIIVREEDIAKVSLYVDLASAFRKDKLHWKFNELDMNKDDQLNKAFEFYSFMREIHHFVKSRKMYDKIFTLIDEDDDGLISKVEWLSFLGTFSTMADSDESGSTTIDDEESNVASGDNDEQKRSVKSSRSLPEVMKEFVKKLRKQQGISHSADEYF